MGRPAAVSKLQVIDIVRTFSIGSVLAIHYFLSSTARMPGQRWVEWLWVYASRNGFYGVFLFFVVSGFLITRMIDKISLGLNSPDLRAFYTRRAGRILPLLFLVILVGVLTVLWAPIRYRPYGFCYHNPYVRFDGAFWSSIALFWFNWYQAFLQKPSTLMGLHWDVLWSLSIEEQFYIFYPLILVILGTRRRLYLFLGMAVPFFGAVMLAGLKWLPLHSREAWTATFDGFSSIALGALLYLLSTDFRSHLGGRKAFCLWLCVLGVAAMGTAFGATSLSDPADQVAGPLLVAAGLFLFLLGGLNLEVFESKKLAFLGWYGRLSYGAYLLHTTVLYWIWNALLGMDMNLGFLLFTGATGLVSVLSYRFYEMPMNQWIRGWLRPSP
jgi:peptidoglycan/LPS O-acetylase OafA/YrhL